MKLYKNHNFSWWKRAISLFLSVILVLGLADVPLFREVTYAKTYTLSGELRMKKGQVGTLEMDNVDFSGDISWKSSNPAVAKVRQIGTKCEVTGVGGGTCWITFTTNGTSYRRKLIVSGKKVIMLSQSSAVLVKGKKLTLQLYHANKKVTWRSSNKKVATVSKKGVVTAKKKGNAVITAETNGKKYKCKVKVVIPGEPSSSSGNGSDGKNGSTQDSASESSGNGSSGNGSSGNESSDNGNSDTTSSDTGDSTGMSFTNVSVPSLSAKEKKTMQAGNQALKAYTNARLLTEKMEDAVQRKASASELEKITNDCAEAWRIAMNLSEMTEGMGRVVENEAAKAKSAAQNELLLSLFAKSDDDAVKKWAEKITKMYDAGKPGKQVRTLAQQLGVDAKSAYEQLKAAQDIIKNGALADADSYDKLYKIAAATKTTAKVAGVIAATIATGGVAASMTGAVLTTTSLCVNSVDAVVEVYNTTSMIVLGEDHVCTVAMDKLNQKTAQAAAWTGLLTGNWTKMGDDEFQYLGESMIDLYYEGKIMGGTWNVGALKWKLFSADSDNPATVKIALIEAGFSESKADELVKSLEEKPEVQMLDWSEIPATDLDEIISDTDVVSDANNPEKEVEEAYKDVTGEKYTGTEKDTSSGTNDSKEDGNDTGKDSGIHLNHTSLTLQTGTSKQLQLLDGNGNPITSGVTWSVDSDKFYTIDQTGLITCNGPTTSIIAPSLSGYTATATYDGEQYTCKLTWKKKMPSIDEEADSSSDAQTQDPSQDPFDGGTVTVDKEI